MVEVVEETPSAHSLVLDIPGWQGAVAGQHLDVRLTAPDGYQASRSYSLASGPREAPMITVQRVDDGEVSPYLVDGVEVGEQLEVLGPLGGYFVWHGGSAPVLLVGGGSGIVPLRSIWRARSAATPMRVFYSARGMDRVLYGREIEELDVQTVVHLTRERVDGYGYGRLDAAQVQAAITTPESDVYICGPTVFVESMAQAVLAAGVPAPQIRTERFG
ncbi:FAD-binding oxidoreductase [Ruania alba]|uniref:FAD-binding oxidoreductase n=1 Tax=Ruania alba TaxID=648782 RepID=UPI000ADAE3A4|nr:FAD-binding oxidoreductase [Ruania alba]